MDLRFGMHLFQGPTLGFFDALNEAQTVHIGRSVSLVGQDDELACRPGHNALVGPKHYLGQHEIRYQPAATKGDVLIPH